MNRGLSAYQAETRQMAGVLLAVVAFHLLALAFLWSHPVTPEAVALSEPLLVNFVAPSTAPSPAPVPVEPRPAREVTHPPVPAPRHGSAAAQQPTVAVAAPATPSTVTATQPAAELASAASVARAAGATAPPGPPAAAPQTPLPSGPVELAQLSVACTERPAPSYPAYSRRMAEEGTVILLVELQEDGSIASARVEHGSNYPRLDEAALKAVRAWHCNAPLRNGHPVKAVARQPFNFVLGD